ncbi:MAG: hypothetical protein WAR78_05550 [Ferruginibacter sp.]
MRQNILFFLLVFILAVNIQCRKKDPPAETRSFYMGTTPWPADFTVAEVDTAYRFINEHCDIVSHHFDEGIPYEEAFYNRPMPASLLQDITTRKSKTVTGKKIFLSVSALALNRTSRPEYYANAPAPDSIKNYWRQLPFDDAKVITAYVNYVSWLVDQLQPVYVNYGVESNAAGWNASQFVLYKNFIAEVYRQLKTRYPSLPFFISFIVDESNEGFNNAGQLVAYTDFIGLSAYPYITVSSSANGNTDPKNFPAGYFEKFTNLSNSKPLAFAETGYIAEDLVIPAFSLNKQGNAGWQRDYLEMLLTFCNDKKAKLFIWFCGKDYDAGNNTLRNLNLYQDLFGLWEDTGLKDENGIERPAYKSWLQWVHKSKTQ